MSRIKVTLREKKISNGRISLYLDYYPAILNSEGKRTRREFLGMYTYQKPKNAEERKQNKDIMVVANQIRDKRNIELINREYGFKDNLVYNTKLTDIYRQVVDQVQDKNSHSNYAAWEASYKVFQTYFKEKNSKELDKHDVELYRSYLLSYKSVKTKEVISESTASTYFKHFIQVIKYAYKEKLIKENLVEDVKHISYESKPRDYLTRKQIESLINTKIKVELVKDICFFMILTGKRFVEVTNLRWSDVGLSDTGHYYLKIKETKNQKYYNHPISDEAYDYIKKQPKKKNKIFDISYRKAYPAMKQWLKDANLSSDLAFHNFRHTYATLQIESGTDLYTVSKLLGHKSIKTTEIYTKVTDKKKSETVNKIKIKRDES